MLPVVLPVPDEELPAVLPAPDEELPAVLLVPEEGLPAVLLVPEEELPAGLLVPEEGLPAGLLVPEEGLPFVLLVPEEGLPFVTEGVTLPVEGFGNVTIFLGVRLMSHQPFPAYCTESIGPSQATIGDVGVVGTSTIPSDPTFGLASTGCHS